jgi:hypothetical protein
VATVPPTGALCLLAAGLSLGIGRGNRTATRILVPELA